jgi:phospholipase C
MANQLNQIEHIVQLMLENRSFDQMLGLLYHPNNQSPAGNPFDGLTGNESNPDGNGNSVQVFRIDKTAKHPYLMPGTDPGEGFYNTNFQLFSTDDPEPGAVPDNKGFVINFKAAIASDQSKHFKDSLAGTQPADVMGMYSPEMLPIMSGLAKGYAVSDRWFASAPTETIPNRAFAAAATSQGHLDDHVKVFTCPSIFGRLSEANIDWAIFGYNRDPVTRLDYTDTKTADEHHFGHFRDFKARAAAGTLPAYTFLEPDFGAAGNSQHPNYDVSLGEVLIWEVYTTLRTSPAWNDTLLLVTYDEHGGNYDHVPPPSGAVPPDNSVPEFDFDFKRFGVRIPALLISPRIKAGTVFRSNEGTVDHTSVLKTIEERWNLRPLTARDAAAPSLADVLALQQPRTDDPIEGITPPTSETSHPNQSQPSLLEKIHATKVSQLQVRNDKGSYDHHTPPDLSSSAAIGDYIQTRTAAWIQHLQRRKQRRMAREAIESHRHPHAHAEKHPEHHKKPH